MALSQLYSAIAGDTITAARWNNEFGNIYSNGTDVAFPLTKAVSYNGFTVTYDVAGVSTITSPSSTGFLFTIGSKSGTPGVNGSLATVTASTYTDTNTAISGTAALWTGLSIRQPTLAASNTGAQTTLAATVYVEGAPANGTNETINAPYAFYAAGGMIGAAAGSDITSAAAIAVTSPFSTVTGTVTIASISTAYPAGTSFKLRFTGAGLNITYNASSMISPWGRDYRTAPNEVLEFMSLGSGNYTFYSLNGPKERVSQTIETGTSSVPSGFLAEDGAAVSRTTYSGLFAEIGTAFGVGDGSTTFNTPDSQGRSAVNAGTATYAATCVAANVSAANDDFTIASQTALYTGRPVVLTTTGSAPAGLTAGVTYYIIRETVSGTTVQLATSEANARAGTQIDITGQGTGTHTLTATFTAQAFADKPGEGSNHIVLASETVLHSHSQNVQLAGAGSSVGPAVTNVISTFQNGGVTNAMSGASATANFNILSPSIVKHKYIRF